MPKPFKNLTEEKQSRIINAALEEFGSQGYDQASTNAIVKQAGIGKGMLFYYFNNKQELYHYLINYSFHKMKKQFIEKLNMEERDFIKRFKQTSLLKMEFFSNHPHMFNFLGTVLLVADDQMPEDIRRRIKEMRAVAYESIYKNIDFSLFRDDVDADKALQLIQWSMEGYQQNLSARLEGKKMTEIDLEPYLKEFDEYLNVLRTSFYK
ncbi:TetR/AcrR family transcriptional regulator [Halalkalibacillus halophilus]|uniref:TetR/AcrR family transcriptional regulator n=1 Tax=Halalkalibacillus halophilus TaxID=392827 RepID=UPI0004291809|nr:TetR/AcrR family transcriptional regulator [Halalkalibacillus halophilus]